MVVTTTSACIQAEKEDIAKIVLMPGDPLRAKYVAEHYLENPVCFNTVRNMLGYTGTYKGKKISVMGSGMGIPSMNLYARELYEELGVEAIIRIGSTGGLSDKVKMRDIVIAMSASTNSDMGSQFDFPGKLAPTANWEMLRTAVLKGEELNAPIIVGPMFTSETFLHARKDANEKYRDMGMLCVDMETAGLYMTAQFLGKKALSIMTVSDHLFTGEYLSAEERQESFHEMMEVALETAWNTIE